MVIAYEYLKKKGEVYFQFECPEQSLIPNLSEIISIDNRIGNSFTAYANEQEFAQFLPFDFYYEVLTHPGDRLKNPAMSDYKEVENQEWDKYPTYQGYLDMMNKFATDYPELCQIVKIGESVKKRDLLFAKLSDNVSKDEPEPRFMYTSTMHGDETTGYVLMLRLIDYLLKNYKRDEKVTKLIENAEIWIMPLENPDGTFYKSETSVSGSRRANANGVDLNRNYPSIGIRDGHKKEVEVEVMMALTKKTEFVMAANFHGGIELINYPWDTWKSSQKITADDNWWQMVSRKYADDVHAVNSNYFKGQNNGVTNGGDWYVVKGSRQDWMNYHALCREATIELSGTKTVSASSLPKYWDYNYQALLNYIEQSLFGIHGVVLDSVTNKPIKDDPEPVKVFIENHDKFNSHVYTKQPNGDFHRPIMAGTYSVTFSHEKYHPRTLENVVVKQNAATDLTVKLYPKVVANSFSQQMQRIHSLHIQNQAHGITIKPNTFTHKTYTLAIYNVFGQLVNEFTTNGTVFWNKCNRDGRPVGKGSYLALFQRGSEHLQTQILITQ